MTKTKFADIRLILTTEKEKPAQVVIDRLRKQLSFELVSTQPYHKGGFEACLRLPVVGQTWPDQIYSVLCSAQIIGRQWRILGSIEEELDMVTDDIPQSGVEFVSISYRRD